MTKMDKSKVFIINKTELFNLESAGYIINQLMIDALNYYHPGRATLMITNPAIQENSDDYQLATTIEIVKKELMLYSKSIHQSEWLRSFEAYVNFRDELNNEEIFNIFCEYWEDILFVSAEDDGWFCDTDVKMIYYLKQVIKLTNLRTLSEEEWLNKPIN